MKIRPVGTELLHADRRTDTKTLIVTFRYFANVPKTDSVHTDVQQSADVPVQAMKLRK
jgi:hypothetical protein